ncbi:MAG: SPFH domain-containing protein [Pseudomonadota bacterium]
MATILKYGPLAQLRSEASNHIIRYRNGRQVQTGRGLVFWFIPETASIVELPMEDRQTTLFVKGRSQDFQDLAIQGAVIWHVADPQKLAARVDFTLNLTTGLHNAEPLTTIDARVSRLAEQAAQQYFAEAPVRTLLDAGADPLRDRIEVALKSATALDEIGIGVSGLSIGNIKPSKELERALQTPTFEALQQKADEAMFQRRALAVDKERAIAENELANKTELAHRENDLIAKEAENARAKAQSAAEAGNIEAQAQADRIQKVESARTEAERERTAIYRDLPRDVMMGLAAREFAGKLQAIEHLNISPDLLAAVASEFGKPRIPPNAQ